GSYIRCQSSTLASATGSRPIAPPALLTRTSQRSSEAASASTDSWEVTSSVTGVIPGTSAASLSSRLRRRAPATTWKPSAASRRAVASPIPLLAPVTTTVFLMGFILPARPLDTPAVTLCRECRKNLDSCTSLGGGVGEATTGQPGRDDQHAHVTARPARHGRRGRDERVHRRVSQAARSPGCRG